MMTGSSSSTADLLASVDQTQQVGISGTTLQKELPSCSDYPGSSYKVPPPHLSMLSPYYYSCIPPYAYPSNIQPYNLNKEQSTTIPYFCPVFPYSEPNPHVSSVPTTTVVSKILQKGPETKLPTIPPKVWEDFNQC